MLGAQSKFTVNTFMYTGWQQFMILDLLPLIHFFHFHHQYM
uniref:Uncharacterized protein n=1 Tax=Arundo donax TaxID=35708 RepID=A0A0A9AQD5_ARUDO